MRSLLLLMILAPLMCTGVYAYTPPNNQYRGLVENIIQLSKQEENIHAVHSLIFSNLERYQPSDELKTYTKKVEKSAHAIFSISNLYESLINNLRSQLSQNDLEEIERMLQIPLVKQMILLETNEASLNRRDPLTYYKNYTKLNEPDFYKEQLIRQWVNNNPHAHNIIRFQLSVEYMIFKAINPMLLVNPEYMKMYMAERVQQKKELLYFKYLYIYRNINSSDTQIYLDLMATEIGRKFYASLISAHFTTIQQLGSKFITQVVQLDKATPQLTLSLDNNQR